MILYYAAISLAATSIVLGASPSSRPSDLVTPPLPLDALTDAPAGEALTTWIRYGGPVTLDSVGYLSASDAPARCCLVVAALLEGSFGRVWHIGTALAKTLVQAAAHLSPPDSL